MTQIRKPKTIFDASGASTGAWFKTTNAQWDDGKPYSVSWLLAAADTVQIDTSNDTDSAGEIVASPVVTSSEAFDNTTTGTIVEGTWRYIRVVKVGALGNLKVIASI